MIKLQKLQLNKEIHTFWTKLLVFMRAVNHLDTSEFDVELKNIQKKAPSAGRQIAEKYKPVEKAFSIYKKELQKFNAYIIQAKNN